MSVITSRKLGCSNIKVNSIAFGTWPIAGPTNRISESKAIEVLLAAFEAGMNLIDTADAYCMDETETGYGERLVANALALSKKASNIFVTTKGGFERTHGRWVHNAEPDYLKKACDASLRSLGLSHIDLYQLHAPSPNTPLRKSLQALLELKETGKIRHIGLSNVSLDEIKEAQTIIEIATVENCCNPFELSSFESGIIHYCEQNNIAFLAYSPLGGQGNSHLIASHPTLLKVAMAYNATPFQITLAWLLAKSPNMIPICASTNIEHLKNNIKAEQLHLSSQHIQELDHSFGLSFNSSKK